MATINLGRIKPVNKGTWSNSTAYAIDDFVQYTDNGITSTYIAVATSTNQAPSTSGTENSTYWKFMAKGVSDPLSGLGNNKIVTTNSSGNATGLTIGTAGQIIKVNSGANGYEFGDAPSGKVKQIVTATASSTTANSNTTSGYASGALGNVGTNHISANITPTSSSSKLLIQASALCGVGGNGTGLVAVFVDNVAQGAVAVAGYGSDAGNATVSCFVANSSTSQRTVDYRTCGEWAGSACTLGHMRNGNTLSTNSHYGTLTIMEIE